MTTTANQYLNELQEYLKDKVDTITLHINTEKIASLMNEADFAIVTPSVTVNEVIFMGLPFIAIQTADNQNEIAQYLEEQEFQVLRSYGSNKLKVAINVITNEKNYNSTLINIDSVLTGKLK